MSDTLSPCNVKSIPQEAVADKRLSNLSKIYNFYEESEQVQEPELIAETINPVKTDLKELDQLIISILESTKGGPSSPAFVHAIIKNKGYEYTGKQVCNKMWALERKGLIRKEQSGAYLAIQRETAVESDTQE